MIWFITLGWIFVAYLMYEYGLSVGAGRGSLFTLNTLEKMDIIKVDPKTQEIIPGDSKRTIKQIIG